ncbi:MAG: cytochrome c peroxidase [Pseudohongiellaceae bacterium]|jgi:cytochrome c peroxidase
MTAPAWWLAGLVSVALSGVVAADDPPAPIPAQGHELSAELRALALELSPLPAVPPDPTNRVADDPGAARFGQALFFDKRLSGPGTVSCASCHDPALGWGDGRRLAKGVANHPRHSMTLWNVAYNRWFFWDGRKDSLWSQALGPLEDPREHAASRLQLTHLIASDSDYVRAYENVFGALPELADEQRFPPEGRPVPGDDGHEHAQAWATMTEDDQQLVNEVFANMGKAIAAFERKIVSRRAPFDIFVEGLATDDLDKQKALSAAAQRGFELFAGKAQCIVCHDGPQFTDREFHTNRVPTGEGSDPGRGLGVARLLNDPFNGHSVYADDDGQRARSKLSFPRGGWELPGSFKTPTLRNVSRTAPYMHEGQIATLQEVIEFYSTLKNAAPPGQHDENILRPLLLSNEEKADLTGFLEALTDEELPRELLQAPETPYLP